MSPRHVIALLFGGWIVATVVARPDSEVLPRPAPAATSARFAGNAGCSASGCHNANDPRGTQGSEFSIWAGSDPHARAFNVLGTERSSRMVKLLTAGRRSDAKAEKSCLACHAPMENPTSPTDLRVDAVGCEVCHNKSDGAWRTTHYLDGWKKQDLKTKESLGMAPTKDLVHRIQMCANCHVGKPGQEVDHDLIAAGHPRLFFEYATYHHLLPRHWREPDEGSAFDARAWALGQVVTANTANDLLVAQTADSKRWPELSAYNCYSCHHDLTPEGWTGDARTSKDQLGKMRFGTWNFAVIETLASSGRVLHPLLERQPLLVGGMTSAMESGDPAACAAAAHDMQSELRGWLKGLKQARVGTTPWSNPNVGPLYDRLIAQARATNDWEVATQHFLALQALRRSRPGMEAVRKTLLFPAGVDGPAPSREAFHQALDAWRADR